MAWGRFGFGGGGDDLPIDDWMDGRNTDVAQRDVFDAAGRDAWDASTRSGDNLVASQPSDVVALGSAFRQDGQVGGARTLQSGTRTGPLPEGRSPAVRRQTLRPTPEAPRGGPLDGALRTALRGGGLGLAETAGIVAGAVNVATDLLKTADLGRRALDPTDLLSLPQGTSALGQILSIDRDIATYGVDRLAHPSRIADDVKDVFHRTRVSLDPTLTPPAPTYRAELQRRFGFGKNQGRLGADASLVLLGPMAELGLDGAIPYETGVQKFTTRGFSQAQAERLAQPYDGIGHHVVARHLGLPDWITESPIFRLKPRNISQGDFYELHHQIDPFFRGTWFGKQIGGSWSGKKLGLQKSGLAGRVWDGTPSSLKSVVGSGLAGNNAAWDH